MLRLLLAAALFFGVFHVRTADTHTVRVMTYNVHHCNPPDKRDVIDVDAIASVIRKENADVVALQEIDVNTGRSGRINQAEQLAVKAGYKSFYFSKALDFDGGQYGILILSKWPLTDTKSYPLPRAADDKGEQRMLAAGTVTMPGGKTFRFGCTHLEAYSEASRILQAREIGRLAAETSLPFIVAGDFNAHAGSEVIRIVDETFVRTCADCPSTFAEGSETGAIDFIATRPKNMFTVISHRVISDQHASDHFPVVAELRMVER